MKTLGIDEAGRGCVIGPMVMGAVLLSRRSWDQLLKMGVDDSKKLTPKKRSELVKVIRDIALGTEVAIVPPCKIDEYCNKNLLNVLEAEVAVDLIRQRKPNVVYIDAPGRGIEKFSQQVEQMLDEREVCIVAENHADSKYVAVAAASILAKVTRDEEVAKLREEFGDFGSGYPSDPKTQNFLKEICQQAEELPSYIRQSWSTVKKIMEGEQGQLSF